MRAVSAESLLATSARVAPTALALAKDPAAAKASPRGSTPNAPSTAPCTARSASQTLSADSFDHPLSFGLSRLLRGLLLDELLRIVHEKAEGNPLFVEEITTSLQERGVLVPLQAGAPGGRRR